ncbi:MAG: hypothetical protein RI922_989 [Bacteroidota bacterium]|jgi:hypothetical protein
MKFIFNIILIIRQIVFNKKATINIAAFHILYFQNYTFLTLTAFIPF